jgi:cardiolipin synthase
MLKLVPNLLSLLRIVASFFLIPFVLKDDLIFASVIFVAASISDFLDGYLARKFKTSSELGAALDPLADKTLMTVSYVLFAYKGFIPLYVAAIVVGRDLLILLVVAICKVSGVELKMRPLTSSKINTTIQLIFIVLVLACNALPTNVSYLAEASAIIVAASTIFSGAEYARNYRWIKDEIFKR